MTAGNVSTDEQLQPQPQFQVGDRFRLVYHLAQELSDETGEDYFEKVFTVTEWYDHYSEDDQDPHGHPFFDDTLFPGEIIYMYESDAPPGGEIGALYEWEMAHIEEEHS